MSAGTGGEPMDISIEAQHALLQEWRNAQTTLDAHVYQHPVCRFVGQRWGCPDWRNLAENVQVVETRMMDAGMPSPNADIYQGADGAELYEQDLIG